MPSQKHARQVRRDGADRRGAVQAAAAARDRELAELRLKYQPRIAALEIEHAEKRREVWKAYEERCRLIGAAHMLQAGGYATPWASSSVSASPLGSARS